MTSRGHPAAPSHVSLKEAVGSLRVQHRERIHALARWSMAEGRPVPMEHAALILAAEEISRDIETEPFQLMSVMRGWCEHHHVPIPSTLEQSLITYLDFLDEGG